MLHIEIFATGPITTGDLAKYDPFQGPAFPHPEWCIANGLDWDTEVSSHLALGDVRDCLAALPCDECGTEYLGDECNNGGCAG